MGRVNEMKKNADLSIVNHAEYAEDLAWTNFADPNLTETNFTDIERIIIAPDTFVAKIGVNKSRIFPGTGQAAVVEVNITFFELAQLALLLILFDWVCRLFRGDLVLFACPLGNLVDIIHASGQEKNR